MAVKEWLFYFKSLLQGFDFVRLGCCFLNTHQVFDTQSQNFESIKPHQLPYKTLSQI